MVNSVVLQGRLIADPVLNHTKVNVPVTTIRIAVDHNYKNEDGGRGADFIDVRVWRQNAEFVAANFKKGSIINVEGCLTQCQWTDKDGNRRDALQVTAGRVHFAS